MKEKDFHKQVTIGSVSYTHLDVYKRQEALRRRGYDMIGIDNSEEMLAVAMEKGMASETGSETLPQALYLCQDMRSFELYGTVRAAVSICDSMNYILEPEEQMCIRDRMKSALQRQRYGAG